MALLDSYLDYSWEVVKIATANQSMTVRYTTADSDLPDLVRRYPLQPTDYDSASITAIAEGTAAEYSILTQWQDIRNAETDNPSFSDSAFVGKINSTRYKPATSDPSVDNPNVQLFKVVSADSEGPEEIRRTYTLTALDSDEKVAVRNSTIITPAQLWNHMEEKSLVDAHGPALGFNETSLGEVVASASFDATGGAAFDFTTDQFSSFGVDSVSRTAEGIFVVTFDTPISDGYTVVTGAGDQDYSGAGASPRQTAVIAQDSNSVTILCERTDDAVNEDNGYISLAVLAPKSDAGRGALTNDNILFMLKSTIGFGDEYANALQASLSLNDSDFVTWMDSAGATLTPISA